jgi:hypothetical protein
VNAERLDAIAQNSIMQLATYSWDRGLYVRLWGHE